MEYLHLQNSNHAIVADYDLATATAGPVSGSTLGVAARDANHKIFIQRIIVSITTFAAHTLTFQDTAGSPVPIGFVSVPATAPTTEGLVPYVLDFGPRGTPLTVGKDLSLVLSAAGCAGRIHIEGYQRQTGVTYA